MVIIASNFFLRQGIVKELNLGTSEIFLQFGINNPQFEHLFLWVTWKQLETFWK